MKKEAEKKNKEEKREKDKEESKEVGAAKKASSTSRVCAQTCWNFHL